ncbi:MAG TPA: PAS domain S-box protein [Syntrophorhabdaceae bacterium]|nr:PAS domain S-box protein [Syntrophorhabdaceae bacterium]
MENREKQFLEQLQLFKVLLDNMPDPVYYKDVNGFYLGYNKAFQACFGRGNENYVGKTVFDLPINGEEAIRQQRMDMKLIKSPGSETCETTITYPDGSVRQAIEKKATFYTSDGSVGGIVGIITDVTELKRAQELVRDSEARFKDLSQASHEAIMFIEKGIIINANGRTYEMFGYDSEEEIIRRNALDLIAPEARTTVKERITLQNEEKHETLGLKKNGDIFPIEVRPRETNLRGRQIRISVIRDLTEQKKLEEEVLMAKNLQSVGTLAGGVAHDFNNLLMAIVGNISLAKMNALENRKAIEFLTEAERIAFLGKNLTQQLLIFSRGGDPVRKIVLVDELVKDTIDKALRGSLIRPNYTVAEGLLSVEVDEDQIRQVIQNLVVNAKEAMPSGGMIAVECKNASITPHDKLPLIKEDHVCISIRDEGAGISEENLPKIFDPYFTTKEMGSQKGVGLGLAISYSIIKKHNGHIDVESTPNKGTLFQIYLPASKKEAADTRIESRVVRHGKGRVLVMDDEEMILSIAKELLQHLGYEVVAAQNGEEAIGFYRQARELKKPFDVVILDLAIPDSMGGKEVMQELIALDPRAKGIISSGYLNDPIIKDFKNYGFLDVLTKPYDANELDEKLQNIIRRDDGQLPYGAGSETTGKRPRVVK